MRTALGGAIHDDIPVTAAVRDAPILAALRELAGQYPRYGYRRMQIFLERMGWPMSADRAHRLWRLVPRPLPATGPNQVWAYDFVFDACANDQRLKCLTVVDEYPREALAIDVAGRQALAEVGKTEAAIRTVSDMMPASETCSFKVKLCVDASSVTQSLSLP